MRLAMKERIQPYAKVLYRTLTPETERYALYAILASAILFTAGTMFFGGIAVGANASVAGEGLGELLSQVSATEFQLWMDFATEGTLQKVVFGLFYPIIAGVFTALKLGMYLGYAVPELGYVVNGLSLLWPVVGLGLIVLQFVRFYNLSTE